MELKLKDIRSSPYTAIGLVWLFQMVGMVAVMSGFGEHILPLSPGPLLLSLVLLFMHHPGPRKHLLIACALIFIVGFGVETIGVQTGLLFGSYSYGSNLGPKALGVPFMIGMNWVLLTWACAGVVRPRIKNVHLSVFLSAGLMVLLDVLMEQAAPVLDFWSFAQNQVPLRNYIDWFWTGLITQSILHYTVERFSWKLSLQILLAMAVFFVGCLWAVH